MTSVQLQPQVGNATQLPTRRAALIRLLGGFVVAVFVVSPSLLFYFGGIGLSPILTGSMEPGIRPGDVIVTRETPVTDLRVGDVVTLVSSETKVLFAHRIIEITEQSGSIRIITQGDANDLPDASPFFATMHETIPKRIATVPWVGHVLVYLTSVQGRQASLALVVTANVIALFLWLFREQVVQVGERALRLYRDLYADAHAAQVEKQKLASTYKNLYMDAESSRVETQKKSMVFQNLYEEQRQQFAEKNRQNRIFRDVFEQSQENQAVREFEMNELINEINTRKEYGAPHEENS